MSYHRKYLYSEFFSFAQISREFRVFMIQKRRKMKRHAHVYECFLNKYNNSTICIMWSFVTHSR